MRTLGEAAAAAGNPEPYTEPGKYVFQITLAAAPGAGDHFSDLKQFIDKDSDFELTDLAAVSTGDFSFNYRTPGSKDVFSTDVHASNALGTGQFPVPVVPSLVYLAGSKLGLSLTNLTAAPNTIEIVFSGRRIYPTS
jgi:hypothetical protein